MHRHSATVIATVFVLAGGLLNACATAAAGPQTWIDKPLDNTTAPVAPLSIIAHASASGGVARMEFTVDGVAQWNIDTGGGRLVWQQVEWTPPGPGTYLVGARGIGTDGSAGALATSLVTISGEQSLPIPLPVQPTATIVTPTATITPTVTITPITPEAAKAPSAIAKMNANCREGPGVAYEAYGSLLAGQQAEIKGRLSDNSWLLISLVGRSSNCWIAASVADVSGDLGSVRVVSAGELPPVAGGEPPPAGEEPPVVDIIQPPPLEVDTTPPVVAATINRQSMQYNQTATSTVIATDDGGIYNVHATWSITDPNGIVVESGSVDYALANAAWHSYKGQFGPFGSDAGTLRINGVATDNAGNTTTFAHVVTVIIP